MDLQEATSGNRVIVSVNCVGGVKRDIDAETQKWILDTMKIVEKEVLQLKSTIMDDFTVKDGRSVSVSCQRKKPMKWVWPD